MRWKIAILHTSFIFIQRERLMFDLLQEILPDVQVTNIVDDTMLKQVMDNGRITPDIIRRMCLYVLAADAMEVDAILSPCSSLGPAVDVAKHLVSIPVVKIDEGMAEKAVMDGKKISVMATVATTLPPTVDLIREKAQTAGKEPEIRSALCDGAFQLLNKGEVAQHDAMVSAKAQETAQWADTIVLAQGSMARLAPRLSEETGRMVLSSPRLGIERLKQALELAR